LLGNLVLSFFYDADIIVTSLAVWTQLVSAVLPTSILSQLADC